MDRIKLAKEIVDVSSAAELAGLSMGITGTGRSLIQFEITDVDEILIDNSEVKTIEEFLEFNQILWLNYRMSELVEDTLRTMNERKIEAFSHMEFYAAFYDVAHEILVSYGLIPNRI
jgi:hypothetical protein